MGADGGPWAVLYAPKPVKLTSPALPVTKARTQAEDFDTNLLTQQLLRTAVHYEPSPSPSTLPLYLGQNLP